MCTENKMDIEHIKKLSAIVLTVVAIGAAVLSTWFVLRGKFDRGVAVTTNLSDRDDTLMAIPSDNGNTLMTNPLLWADVPDPSVIRVGDTYYMVSTTMHMSPGCTIMKSKDLINWTVINYAYDVWADTDGLAMRNGETNYSGASWAATLRYNKGVFIVGVCSFSTWTSHFYQTRDIENGPWERYTLPLFYDMSLLFDDDDRTYVVCNGEGGIILIELTEDAKAVKTDKYPETGTLIIPKEDFTKISPEIKGAEGAHFYKVNGKYYLFLITWTEGGRTQLCFSSDNITGPYTGRIVLKDRSIAQGGIFDMPNGDWYSMLFQDRGAVGRCPMLLPVTWKDGWPVFGKDGKVPDSLLIPVSPHITKFITVSDEFDNDPENNYRKRHNLDGYSTPVSRMTSAELNEGAGTELLQNGTFESNSISPWQATEKAPWIAGESNLSISQKQYQGNNSLHISNRVDRGEGIRQNITGVKPARQYSYTAAIRYDGTKAKESKLFQIGLQYGNNFSVITGAMVEKDVWKLIEGTFTVPVDADISNVQFMINLAFWEDEEIPDGAKAADYLSDIYFDNLSVVQNPFTTDYYKDGEYNYNGSNLQKEWQWNHNPDNRYWSLTERPGYLRLTTGRISTGLTNARNTLSQRAFGPHSSASIAMEVGGMKNGDVAGFAAFQDYYGFVGIKMEDGKKYIVMNNTIKGFPIEEERVPFNGNRIYFKINMIFSYEESTTFDLAYFFYSLDGVHWNKIGSPLYMVYNMTHFVGYRFALFNYATEVAGGCVDFDYFRLHDIVTSR